MADSVAHVFKNGVRAATLTRVGSEVSFRYLPGYLAADGEPVATTLPLTTDPVVNANSAVPAFFAGLLPEGRRLGAIASRLKVSLDNDIALLLEIGADLIGDVQVLASEDLAAPEREVLMLPLDTGGLDFGAIREQYFGSRASGIPGVQDKISSKMLNARARKANEEYILKLNPTDVPFAVENEAFFLALAKICRIDTTNFDVLTDSKGERALLLKRFDRVPTPKATLRLAIEDACQVLNLYPGQKYDLEFTQVAAALMEHTAASKVAGLELLKQLVFSWLTANGDAHAKNFSIVQTLDGEWRISPAYDLLCTYYYDDRTMALTLDGEATGWTRAALVDASAKLSLPKAVAESVIDLQLAALASLPQAIIDGALPLPRNQNYDVAAALKQRAKQLR
jgi:serine/threonine-protein kinase HipA